jgi:hypothetical protein
LQAARPIDIRPRFWQRLCGIRARNFFEPK